MKIKRKIPVSVRVVKDAVATSLTGFTVLVIIAMIVSILGITIAGGWKSLTWEFLTQYPKDGMTRGGIFPAIFGTALMTLIMTIAAVPFGVITAVYLAEYATEKSVFAKTIRFAVKTLAVVPSIIFGLFGLGFFIKFMGTNIDNAFFGGELRWGQPNILWASLTMALLTLPVVIVAVEEAIRTIPRDMREASMALGATKWQTIRNVVLPGSMTGILTGTILAISRGAGEVAPILFTGAAYYVAELPVSLNQQFMSLGYHIYIMSTQSTNVDETLPLQFATTLVLLLLTFSLSLIAVILRYRIRKKAIHSS
ncbi:MAG: phosphate ABC transporter permease PstA [Bacteroidales bacterium]|nr:phosphate ABC transporter permease PstA [Bacteroidales bacterium]MBN2761447.1 phosphate ABC transporter permease PstA [Bacteroidales bacterium]